MVKITIKYGPLLKPLKRQENYCKFEANLVYSKFWANSRHLENSISKHNSIVLSRMPFPGERTHSQTNKYTTEQSEHQEIRTQYLYILFPFVFKCGYNGCSGLSSCRPYQTSGLGHLWGSDSWCEQCVGQLILTHDWKVKNSFLQRQARMEWMGPPVLGTVLPNV